MPTDDKVTVSRKEFEELKKKVETMSVGKPEKKKRQKNPNAKPNPYIEFGKKMRKENKEEYEGKSVTEVAKLIGKEWQKQKAEAEKNAD